MRSRLGAEAQVQQAVGFVQHQGGHVAQAQRVVLRQIQQPAWRGDHEVGSTAQRQQLRIDRAAAGGGDDLEPSRQVRGQLAQRGLHLCGEFAGGYQYQRTEHARRGVRCEQALLQQRQRIGQRLARAGLRHRDQVAPGQHRWDELLLDRRGRAVAGLVQRGLEKRQ